MIEFQELLKESELFNFDHFSSPFGFFSLLFRMWICLVTRMNFLNVFSLCSTRHHYYDLECIFVKTLEHAHRSEWFIGKADCHCCHFHKFSNAFLFKYIQLALSKYGKYAGIILKQISIRTLRFEHMKTLRGLAEIPLLLELRKHQDIKYRCYNYLVGSLAI